MNFVKFLGTPFSTETSLVAASEYSLLKLVLSLTELTSANSRLEVFCKKVALKSFEKFVGKKLCQSLFFNEVLD